MVWNANQTKRFLSICANTMVDNKTMLIEIDSIVGDGDLGLTMSDGFQAAYTAIKDSELTDCGKLFFMAGKAMSKKVPSTMGTLMSKGLMSVGMVLKGKEEIQEDVIYTILSAWLDGVQSLGKAKKGDKTFLDGLYPVIDLLKSNEFVTKKQIVECAQNASQNTVGMIAVHGRAAIRGEASRALIDPGAVVAKLIVEALIKSYEQ